MSCRQVNIETFLSIFFLLSWRPSFSTLLVILQKKYIIIPFIPRDLRAYFNFSNQQVNRCGKFNTAIHWCREGHHMIRLSKLMHTVVNGQYVHQAKKFCTSREYHSCKTKMTKWQNQPIRCSDAHTLYTLLSNVPPGSPRREEGDSHVQVGEPTSWEGDNHVQVEEPMSQERGEG